MKPSNVHKDTMEAYADLHYELPIVLNDKSQDPLYQETLDRRRLKFRARTWLEPRAWQRLMSLAIPDGYGKFEAKQALRWLNNIERDLDKIGKIEIQPARESSVAAYIQGNTDVLTEIVRRGTSDPMIDSATWVPGKEGQEVRLWWASDDGRSVSSSVKRATLEAINGNPKFAKTLARNILAARRK